MRYLIDTNCCIYIFSNQFPCLTERMGAIDQGDVGLSVIVFAELALGSMNGKAPPMAALERLLVQMPLMPFDENAARAYGRMPFRRGRFDRLLAAQALSLDLVIITRNLADFADIAGLKVEDWTR